MKSFATVTTPIVLRWPVRSSLEAAMRAMFDLGDHFSADFLRPAGEAAFVSPDSVCGVRSRTRRRFSLAASPTLGVAADQLMLGLKRCILNEGGVSGRDRVETASCGALTQS
jgi:hypothetical protein